ncbi:Dnaj-like subfamily c member 7 protein [Dioscorea alata]|uniref:Dnaj-like subfamily c member 7 protein n=1 Tax=Dioscorea alata TaxID=55571 RepID=A0ACB7V1Z5_DIOAL|nr:Dnaj-like subfamily c member 7 protein [Dioscorea alata]
MVGILTSPADLESRRSLSGNPRKGEISPLSRDRVPFAFDRALGSSFRYMDQNSYGFFPAPASSSFSSWGAGSGKGTPAEGLSKPRLVKTRRRVPSSDAKPGFNPFQSGADRRDVGGMQGLPERFRGLNPFDKLPSGAASVFNSNARDASGSDNSGSFESVSSESNANSSGFVFGAGAEKSENLNKNSSLGSDGNSGVLHQMGKVDLQSNDNEAGTTTVLGGNSGLNHSSVAGSGEVLFSELPEDMRKLNLESSTNEDMFAKEKQATNSSKVEREKNFIFGSDKNASVSSQFGTTENFLPGKWSDMSQRLSAASDDRPFSKLPEEIRKLNSQNSSSHNAFETPKDADCNVKVDGEGAFIFGTDKNMPFFNFGSNVHRPEEHISKSKQKSSLGSEDSPFSKLPEEMRKLNLQSSGSQNVFETPKEADHNDKVDVEGAFIFGTDKNVPPSFHFGSSVRLPPEHVSKSKQKSSLGFQDGPFSKLSEEMRKLNLQSSGSQDFFETAKEADHNVKVDGARAFIFGAEKNSSTTFQFGSSVHHPSEQISKSKQKSSLGSEDNPFSKLPEEMRKLNLQSSSSKNAFDMTKEAARKNASTSFKFGSSPLFHQEKGCNSSLRTSHSCDDIPFSTLQEEKRELNIGNSSNESAFEAAREADHCSKVDGEKIFIFGGDKNASMSFPFVGTVKTDTYPSEKSSNTVQRPCFGSDDGPFFQLPEEMKKLNLQSSSREHAFEKPKEDDHSYMHDVEKTFFGSANNMPNFFQFGNSANCPQEKSSDMGEKSMLGSDYDLPSKVSDVASKMNLQGLGNENGFGYTDQVDHSQNLFLGSNRMSFSVLPDEMRELNMNSSGNKDGLHNTKPAAQNSDIDGRKTFLVGSSKNETSFFGASTSDKFAEKMKTNIGIEKPSADANSKSGHTASGFVFGSSDSLSSSIGGSSASTLPTDMSKEQSTSDDSPMDASTPFPFQEENQGAASNLGEIPTSQGFGHSVPAGANLDAHDPFKFSFQSKKQDANSSMGTIPSTQMHTGVKPSGVPETASPMSSSCHGFQSFETEFSFGKMNIGFQTPHVKFKTTNQVSSSFCENLFAGGCQKVEFGSKKGASKATQLKKKRGKLRQSATFRQSNDEIFISRENISQDKPAADSFGEYSPMDYSPYHDKLATDQCSSREASSASDEPVHLPSHVSKDTHSIPVDGRDRNLFFAAHQFDISEGDLKHVLNNYSSQAQFESTFPLESAFTNVQNLEIGTGSFMPETEGGVDLTNDTRTAPANEESFPFSTNIDGPANEDRAYIFESHVPDSRELKFTFSASSSTQGPLFSSKRHSRRKDRIKADKDLCNFTLDAKIPFPPKFSPASSISQVTAHAQGEKDNSDALSTEDDNMVEAHAKLESRQRSTSTAAVSIAAEEACENWRLRGNQAYANGHLPKAEEYYTRGINSVSPNETLQNCLRVLMLCYSNRAAARMSLGRMREALNDSLMAASIDPNFPKAQLRAANCHLALGETVDAMKHYQNCLQLERTGDVDHKICKEATDGLGKAQLVAGHMEQSENILLKRASVDAKRVLELISDALLISPFSEKLLEMKAEVLFMLRKYDEVIALCEKTLDLAEKNAFSIVADGKRKDRDTTEGMKSSTVRLWRWYLISKSNFYLGKLDEALELLQEQEQIQPIADKYVAKSSELSAAISELLRLKSAGNEAFQAGRYSEAVESYTAALTLNIESRPFTAICFCNRAAAYQALGQITDAIADCSLAIALDTSYAKAISRRATLHEMIRDYHQASNDLRRLMCLLEKQSNKDDQSGTLRRSNSNASELKRVQLRLSMMEDEARKEIPLDMYLILGIESSSSEVDLKKAYRKAALKHHPDKVSRFFVRSENADEGFWKEVADEVRTDADRLFKLIHEAYTTLSDPTKRLQYDTEEEIRTSIKKGYSGSGKPKAPTDKYSSPYEKSTNRRQWREGWKPYGSSQYQWSDSSRSNWQY